MAWKSAMSHVITPVPFLELRSSMFPLTPLFKSFYTGIRLTADVRIIGAVYLFSLKPECLECPSPSRLSSAGQNLRVATTLGGVPAVAGAAVVTAFLEVRAASSVQCRFRLRISLNPPSWLAGDFGAWDWPDELLAFNKAFSSCRATV
jgi:hypothetical protein